MRILLAIHHETDVDSGASGTFLELANAYEAAGHAVRLLSYDDFPIDLPHRAKDLVFPEFAAWRMWKIAQEVDLIDASTGDAWLWARLYRFAGNKRSPLLVTRSHGLEHIAHEARMREAAEGRLDLSWRYPVFYGGLRLWEVSQSLRLADLVFLLNEHDRRYATGRLGVAPERCHIVRNGLPDYLIGLAEPEPRSDERIRVAMLGSYSLRKGIDYAMPALRSVLERQPSLELSMLGTGTPAATVLAGLPAAVHNRVTVMERYRRNQLPELLKGHQITLLASLSEGFGKAALEAMSCGLAPICTDSPGPTEFIEHEVNGLIVPPRSTEGIEGALERLIGDRAELARLRAAAHRTAQGFSWAAVADERLQMYERALAGRPAVEGAVS
jgi:glycosyltransferase involved in cell wall biosynthesis